jgi:hypothetical protein
MACPFKIQVQALINKPPVKGTSRGFNAEQKPGPIQSVPQARRLELPVLG